MSLEDRLDKIERDIDVIKTRLNTLQKHDELLYGKNSLSERVTSLEIEIQELRKEINMISKMQNRNLALILSALLAVGSIISLLVSLK